MKIKLRDLARNPAAVRRNVSKGNAVVLTSRNDPFAVIIPINELGFKVRSLLLEAGKIMKKAGLSEEEALRLVKKSHRQTRK